MSDANPEPRPGRLSPEAWLAEASGRLAESLDEETTAQRSVTLPVPALADACLLDLVIEAGALSLSPAETAGRDVRGVTSAEQLPALLARVLRQGQPRLE